MQPTKKVTSSKTSFETDGPKVDSRVEALIDSHRPYLTDGGLETTLVFHDGVDLPEFASYAELQHAEGRARLRAYSERYLEIAREARTGFVLETPTWRANLDWGRKIGTSEEQLVDINRLAARELNELRQEWETSETPIVVSGNIGPRGDGYEAGDRGLVEDHTDHHRFQIEALASAGVDVITALTMTTVEEAAGVALAARQVGLPVVISFTVETDGRIPTGASLREAIESTDEITDAAPVYYMVNCAHPTHFDSVLEPGAPWTERIGGVRANASRCSHAELDAAETLDEGDPAEFGRQNAELFRLHPRLKVLGGCCGTDHRHVRRIAIELSLVNPPLRAAS